MSVKRVLWADDDYPSFPVIDRILRKCGATVDRVITLTGALDLLEQKEYDLIIMDAILIKGGDELSRERYEGAELFKRAKEKGLRTIVLTIVPESELPFRTDADYKYFHKIELGPRLEEFSKAVEECLSSR